MRLELENEPPVLWIGRLGIDLDPVSIPRFRRTRHFLVIYPHPQGWTPAFDRHYIPARGLWPFLKVWSRADHPQPLAD